MTSSTPTPRETPDRCAFRAGERGDPLLGTAFPAGRILLVEQPGPWGSGGITESDFDRVVSVLVKARVQNAGLRVQLIRRPGRHAERDPRGVERQWAYVDCREGREQVRWGCYTDERELLEIPLDGSGGEPSDDPVFLVCTNGRHDPCCALRGRPVVLALHELRPGKVWETTHTGGDRFAANVLALPSGLVYGRVEVDELETLVAAVESDEVLHEHLRGRVGHPGWVQAALALAYRSSDSRRGWRVTDSGRLESGRATVRLEGPDGLHTVTVHAEKVEADGLTCHNPAPNRYLRYTASGL